MSFTMSHFTDKGDWVMCNFWNAIYTPFPFSPTQDSKSEIRQVRVMLL